MGGENAGDLAIKIDEKQATLDELMETYETGYSELSEQGQQDLVQQIRDAEREVEVAHNLFMDLYNNTPEELLDTDEYRELKRQAETFQILSPSGNIGAILVAKRRQNNARRAMRDYITNLGLESPVGPTGTQSIQYVDPTTLGGTPAIAKQIKTHFSGGFDPLQIVLDPETGAKDITLQELAKREG